MTAPASAALLIAFLVNERRHRSPLMPLSIFRVRGLAAANATQLIAFAGFLSMFFFLTLYMQSVLGYSSIETGLAYLPVCFVIGISAGIASQLIAKVGTRPLVVGGALVTAVGVGLFARIPVDGSYVADLLPGMTIMSLGIGAVFVAVINAANANSSIPATRSPPLAARSSCFLRQGSWAVHGLKDRGATSGWTARAEVAKFSKPLSSWRSGEAIAV
jgi:predicted MFS family arabinose efflux permease